MVNVDERNEGVGGGGGVEIYSFKMGIIWGDGERFCPFLKVLIGGGRNNGNRRLIPIFNGHHKKVRSSSLATAGTLLGRSLKPRRNSQINIQ